MKLILSYSPILTDNVNIETMLQTALFVKKNENKEFSINQLLLSRMVATLWIRGLWFKVELLLLFYHSISKCSVVIQETRISKVSDY